MARTAPVPNIPAIPGMNPGIFVMGGGGGGGGKGGKGGKGAGGAQGADGENGGDGADGACGGAGSSGCGHPSHSPSGAAGGDPVDIASGVVFTPAETDMALGGPFPLRFQRFYRSDQTERDVGLGPGWSHSFAWSLHNGRRYLRLTRPDGSVVEVSRLAPGQRTIGGSGISVHAFDFGFVVAVAGRQIVFKPAGEIFLPTAILDGFGNTVQLEYDHRGLLMRFVDAVGRACRLQRDPSGHITAVEALNAPSQGRWECFSEYRYDGRGRLAEHIDGVGSRTLFGYDEAGRLVARTTPNGITFHYRYDELGRCLETWGDADDESLLGLAADVGLALADGSPARGIFHCRFTYGDDHVEMMTSRSLNRYELDDQGGIAKAVNDTAVHTRVLNDDALLVSYTDPVGATSTYERDAWGRVVRWTNARGGTFVYARNEAGALVGVVDPEGAETRISHDGGTMRWTDAVNATFEIELNGRGDIVRTRAPNGGETRHTLDNHGNEIHTVGRHGEITRRSFDFFGRCTAIQDASGANASFVLDRRGNMVRTTDALGRQTHYHYDPDHNLSEVVNANGSVTRFRYAGTGWLSEVTFGDGRRVSLRYDREGRLSSIENAAGEKHLLQRNPRGLVSREVTFDGRTLHYDYDLMGQLTSATCADEKTTYAYDLGGALVERNNPDGSADKFSYDSLGRLLTADTTYTSVSFERNRVGWVTRETQTFDGTSESVTRRYDTMGKVIEERSSRGHQLARERDLYGFATATTLDNQHHVMMRRDPLGRPVALQLPSGGAIETSYDALGRVTQRALIQGGARHALPDGQPDWMGPPRANSLAERAFQYGSSGELVAAFDSEHGLERYDYDPCGRLLEVIPSQAHKRVFAYAAGGRRVAATAGVRPTEYAAGGRLLLDDRGAYTYDEAGRLTSALDRDGKTTRYQWKGDLLASVQHDERGLTRFEYDALGRRLGLTQQNKGGDVMRKRRFVWNDERLLHDVRYEQTDTGEQLPDITRTFVIDELGTPWAQKTEAGDSSEWTFALRDHRGVAAHHVGLDGRVVASEPHVAWDARALSDRTPFGLPGQYHDEETGLIYNRHRYYDAAAGMYISPDPVGLSGGLETYAYAADNPMRFVDLDGLMPTSVVTFADGTTMEGNSVSTTKGKQSRTVNPTQPVMGETLPKADTWVNHDGEIETQGRSAGPCAEADLLNKIEKDVREKTPQHAHETEAEHNERIKAEMQKKLKGASIETRDDKGNLMAPCPTCARMFDKTLGPDLAKEVVKMPENGKVKGGKSVPWDGVQTQKSQGDKIVPRPDDERESKLREDNPAYETPGARKKAIDADADKTFKENWDSVKGGGKDDKDALKELSREEATKKYEQEHGLDGQLNDDGSLK